MREQRSEPRKVTRAKTAEYLSPLAWLAAPYPHLVCLAGSVIELGPPPSAPVTQEENE
ncbi:MAG: hypothetical protein Q9171_005972 [Xanthocarpia ochracea]